MIAVGALVSYLRNRGGENPAQRFVRLDRTLESGGPSQYVVGTARTGGQRVARAISPRIIGGIMRREPNLHVAHVLSVGAIDGLEGIHVNGDRLRLQRGRTLADGGIVYAPVSRRPPFGNLVTCVLHSSADGQGGSDFFAVSGAAAPFLEGHSWVHVFVAPRSNDDQQYVSGPPRLEFDVRGILLPPATDPTAAPRYTSSWTDIRYWWHTQLLGETRIDAASVARSARITDEMVSTTLTGNWWRLLERPFPPPAPGWVSSPPTPDAANPVTWVAVTIFGASFVVPYQVWTVDGVKDLARGRIPAFVSTRRYMAGGNSVRRPRYELNGVIRADDSIADIEAEMDFAAGGGRVQRKDGVLFFSPGAEATSTPTLVDAADALSRDVTVGVPPDDVVTQIEPKLDQSAPDGYQSRQLPAVGTDDSRPLRLEGMRFVTWPTSAARIVATYLRQLLRDRRFAYTFPLSPRILELSEGDRVRLTDERAGQTAEPMRLEYFRILPDAAEPRAEMVLRPEPAGIYADSVSLGTAPEDAPVDLGGATPLPGGFTAALVHRFLDDGTPRPAIRATWNPFAANTEVRVRAATLAGGPAPEPVPVVTTDTDSVFILAASQPATPAGGEDDEDDLPSGWSRTEPQPSETLGIWRSQRERSYSDGAFTSATAWGAPTLHVAAMPAPAMPPGVPGLSVAGGAGRVTATVTAPTDGGDATLYRVQLFRSADLSGTPFGEFTRTTVGSVVFTPLADGTTYHVRARAENSAGDSAWTAAQTASTTAAPVELPDVPGLAVAGAENSVVATLTAPTSGGTPTLYRVQLFTMFDLSDTAVEMTRTTPGDVTFGGLTDGTPYWLRARAENLRGSSGWTERSGVVAGPPLGVPGLTVAAQTDPVHGNRITVAVTAPAASRAIRTYRVELYQMADLSDSPNFRTLSAPGTVTLFGQTPGTYYVRARAEGRFGFDVSAWTPVQSVVAPAFPARLRAQASPDAQGSPPDAQGLRQAPGPLQLPTSAIGGYPLAYRRVAEVFAPEGYEIPPADPQDPQARDFTDYRTAFAVAGAGSLDIDAPYGFAYQVDARHVGPLGPGDWTPALTIVSGASLDESPVNARAVHGSRIRFTCDAPQRRDIAGVEIMHGLQAVLAADFDGVAYPVVPGRPVDVLHGLGLGDVFVGAVQARFVTHTGVAGPLASAVVTRADDPGDPGEVRVVVYDTVDPPDHRPYPNQTIFARVADAGTGPTVPLPPSGTGTDVDTVYVVASMAPPQPTGGDTVEGFLPPGTTRTRPPPTTVLNVYASSRVRTYENGVFVSATPWGPWLEIAAFIPPSRDRMEADFVWILASSLPAMPTGGTDEENDVPAGWTRTEPSPTATDGVYRSSRTRTYTAGAFASATPWRAPQLVAAPTGGAITTGDDFIFHLASDTPPQPTGGNDEEHDLPAGWTRNALSPTATEDVWRCSRTRTYVGDAFATATDWSAPERIATRTGTGTFFAASGLSLYEAQGVVGWVRISGNLPGGASGTGATRHNGRLYTLAGGGTLYRLDPDHPARTEADTNFPGTDWQGLADHGGVLYAVTSRRLYTLTRAGGGADGSASLVDALPDGFCHALGSHGGRLYAVIGNDLWEIDESAPSSNSVNRGRVVPANRLVGGGNEASDLASDGAFIYSVITQDVDFGRQEAVVYRITPGLAPALAVATRVSTIFRTPSGSSARSSLVYLPPPSP